MIVTDRLCNTRCEFVAQTMFSLDFRIRIPWSSDIIWTSDFIANTCDRTWSTLIQPDHGKLALIFKISSLNEQTTRVLIRKKREISPPLTLNHEPSPTTINQYPYLLTVHAVRVQCLWSDWRAKRHKRVHIGHSRRWARCVRGVRGRCDVRANITPFRERWVGAVHALFFCGAGRWQWNMRHREPSTSECLTTTTQTHVKPHNQQLK